MPQKIRAPLPLNQTSGMRRARPGKWGRSVAVAAALLTLAGCAEKKVAAVAKKSAAADQAIPVEVMPIERRDLVESLNLVGSVAANETAQVRAEIAGMVREIMVEEGQPVKKGQLLVKIDDREIAAQTDEAESAYQLAVVNLQRSENLLRTNSVTPADRDKSDAEARSAKARLALQRARLEKTDVRAPFDGIVGARAVSPGDYVNNQSIITNVDDLSRLKIEFEVPERFFRQIHPGTKFSLKSPGGAVVSGEVYFVSSAISRETRSSTVKGYLANPPADLKPGMFGNVELVLEVHKNVLVVPEGAVLMTPGGAQIVIAQQKDGGAVAKFVRVRLGLRSRGLVEIIPLDGAVPEQASVVSSGMGAIQIFPDAKLDPRPLRKELRVTSEG